MANQSGIPTLLDKLKQQLKVFLQALNISSNGKAQVQRQPGTVDTETYAGPPLEIGNELLITREMVRVYDDLSNALGRVVIIDQIQADKGQAIKASIFGIHVAVDMKVAQQMRQAYLLREQTSS